MNFNKNPRLDALDMKLLELLLSGNSNSQIAVKLKKPLSTIQRRTRRLLQAGFVDITYELNYKKFGYKKGLLHVYLRDGNASEIGQQIMQIDNILKVTIHIGNSDVVAEYACVDAQQLLTLMAKVKELDGVEKVVWSEEVYSLPATKNQFTNAS